MPTIIPAATFNAASLSADDLYIVIQNPPGFIRGVPTDVIGVPGTASWGPVNQPMYMGSAHDALTNVGPISAASLIDPHDLATDLALAFGQATSGGTLEGFAVRVTDGTDTAASASVPGAASSTGETVVVGGTAHTGDVLNLTVTSTALTGSPITVTHTMTSTDTLATAAVALAAAVNANAVLAAAGIIALSVSSGEFEVYQPTALSPQATFSESVTGGGATTTLTLGSGSAATAGMTLSGIYTGTLGNALQITMQAGASTGSFTALLALPSIGAQESYPNIAGGVGFWSALVSAINNGVSGVRGPSQIARASAPNNAVGAPTLATTTCAGGTDGRSGVTTSTLIGSDSAQPRTGLFALRQMSPAVGVAWIAGNVDPNANASLLSFAQTEGALALTAFATGTSTATATAAVATNGVHDPAFMYTKDWIYWYDPVNAQVRLSPPTAIEGGLIATLPPQVNPGNEAVSMVIGTERVSPTGTQPYTLGEIGQLANAGISFIYNPIPAGSQYGIRTAQTTSLNPATAGPEWWRTSVFLARSFASVMGAFVDQNQSQQPNDPLRNAVKNQLNTFLQSLVGANGVQGVIDAYSVICTFSASPSATAGNGVNTPSSIAQHYLYVLVRVTFLSSVRFFVLSQVGGTTVVTVGATAGQQIAA
jgi:hypothetical protein